MSSDPFDLLGLDRKTATDADVRRAYAERLKVTRPEDDRAGFMALREAFERARNEVRWRDEYGGEDYEEEEDDEQPPEASASIPADVGADPPPADASPGDSMTALDAAPDEPLETFDPPADDDIQDPGDRAITAAMERLIDVLTASGEPAAMREIMSIIDDAALGGIDEYQAMQWQVREFLCDRTGAYLDPPELRTPGWLSVEILDALNAYYGWTRQPVSQAWIRRKNDWLVRLRTQIADGWIFGDSGRSSPPPAHGQGAAKGSDKSFHWLWIAIGIIAVQVIQFILKVSGE